MTVATSPEVVFDYVETVDPNLICAICQSALVDPVTTSSCKHTFCRDCITRAIQHNPSCPIDRSALTLSCLTDTEPLVKLMLDELQVCCNVEGCGIVMQRGLLLAHLRTCKQSYVVCGDDGCGLSMARHRLPHHRAYECFQRKMECNRCGSIITFRENKTPKQQAEEDTASCDLCKQPAIPNKHLHQWSCPSVRVPCTHSSRGCPSIITRSDLSSHLSTCPFEALSSFFIANDARLKAIEDRNQQLEQECQKLRDDVKALGETLSQQSRIESWAGTHLGRIFDTGLTFPPSLPLIRQSSHNRQVATETNVLTATDPELPIVAEGESTTTTSSDATSVTAATIPEPTSGQTRTENEQPQEYLSQPRRNFGIWTLNRLAAAPSTSEDLDQVVETLRHIVIHLAAGLDTAERRAEVRMTTETLRVLDEVGSLRAIVSSMRRHVMTDLPGSPYTSRFSLAHSLSTTQTTSSAVSAIMTPTSSASSSLTLSRNPGPTEGDEDNLHDSDSESPSNQNQSNHNRTNQQQTLASTSESWRPPIRESVVFSDQGVQVSTASRRSSTSVGLGTEALRACTPSQPNVGSSMGVSRNWTGRPCAIPVEQSVTVSPSRRREWIMKIEIVK